MWALANDRVTKTWVGRMLLLQLKWFALGFMDWLKQLINGDPLPVAGMLPARRARAEHKAASERQRQKEEEAKEAAAAEQRRVKDEKEARRAATIQARSPPS